MLQYAVQRLTLTLILIVTPVLQIAIPFVNTSGGVGMYAAERLLLVSRLPFDEWQVALTEQELARFAHDHGGLINDGDKVKREFGTCLFPIEPFLPFLS